MNILEKCIDDMNKAITAEKDTKRLMLKLLRDADKKLNRKDFLQFRRGINLERSTFNKIIKVARSKIITKNITLLPSSWNTLYEIQLMTDKQILSLIKSGSLNDKTTKVTAKSLRTQQKKVTKGFGSKRKRKAITPNNPTKYREVSSDPVITLKVKSSLSKSQFLSARYTLKAVEKYFDISGIENIFIKSNLKEVS